MSKTPYEIRFQLLEMAKDLLMQDFFSKKESVMQEWHMKLEVDKSTPLPEIASFPNESDIIAKAKLLNSFISNEI
jgi:hypothetical protein